MSTYGVDKTFMSILGIEKVSILCSENTEEKREEHPLQVQRWVNRRIVIDVARSYSRMIRRARLPSPLQERESGWDTESGIGLAG